MTYVHVHGIPRNHPYSAFLLLVSDCLKELKQEYCPPLDSSLFTAVALDYNLDNDSQVQVLRETLDVLRLGTYQQDDIDASAQEEQRELLSLEGSLANLDTELSSLSLGGSSKDTPSSRTSFQHSSSSVDNGFVESNFEYKLENLIAIFPSVPRFRVAHTLRTCDEDFDRSMDTLLNIVFFTDDGVLSEGEEKVEIPRGVDGFFDPLGERTNKSCRSGKGKRRKRTKRLSQLPDTYPTDQGVNRWTAGLQDVDFIVSRTKLAHSVVLSTYHRNSSSLSTTIYALAKREAQVNGSELLCDSVTQTQISELRQEFSGSAVTDETLAGLLGICRNSISAASELAQEMLHCPSPTELEQLIARRPALLDLEEDEAKAANNQDSPWKTASRRKPTSTSPGHIPSDFRTYLSAAQQHCDTGSTAYSKASTASRRGKSDRLMSAAAGYYATVGRDEFVRAKKNAGLAADALVESQSIPGSLLDLHGTTVSDATRIAKNHVEDWWEGLGESRYSGGSKYREAINGGFLIVTGVGRHSKDGTSRLGPAVAKALVNNGWKVELMSGSMTVKGRLKARPLR